MMSSEINEARLGDIKSDRERSPGRAEFSPYLHRGGWCLRGDGGAGRGDSRGPSGVREVGLGWSMVKFAGCHQPWRSGSYPPTEAGRQSGLQVLIGTISKSLWQPWASVGRPQGVALCC
jgi:hypothetical protein